MAGCTKVVLVADAYEAVRRTFQEGTILEIAESLGLYAWPANRGGTTLIYAEAVRLCQQAIFDSALPQGGTARRHKRRPATTTRDLEP